MSYYNYWFIPVSTVRGDGNKFRIVAEGGYVLLLLVPTCFTRPEVIKLFHTFILNSAEHEI